MSVGIWRHINFTIDTWRSKPSLKTAVGNKYCSPNSQTGGETENIIRRDNFHVCCCKGTHTKIGTGGIDDSLLQKTITAYWSKRRVENNGPLQNHPNSFRDYHYMVLPQSIPYFHHAKFQILHIWHFIRMIILRHTSLFLYSELIMSFIIRLTSAWKMCFSADSRNSFIWETFRPSNLMASSSL